MDDRDLALFAAAMAPQDPWPSTDGGSCADLQGRWKRVECGCPGSFYTIGAPFFAKMGTLNGLENGAGARGR